MIEVHYSQRIRDLREDNKKTQKDIAEILNTTQSYYAQYENRHRPLPIEHLIALCKYYNVSPDYILGFTNEAKPLPKK
ncbi:MAG: helix-turn-helix transcriptional regulator [Ruminococcaceae bacterium]|nr:helix-turn-helix transcriptional regulator [Oscillospiraceae bacterium]